MPLLEIIVVALLILFNGSLALSELAIVSSRPARLKAMAERGEAGAAEALALASDPGRFLSTVQIGITLVGILSGAFSGTTLGVRLGDALEGLGVPAPLAASLGIAIVVATITYFALIIGELVPKQIALAHPEAVAKRIARPMRFMATLATPVVWLLNGSGKLVLRLIGHRGTSATKVTDEEIAALLAEAETSGVIAPDENRMIAGVMRLADRPVRAIMNPRLDVEWIDLAATPDELRRVLIETRHSHLPAAEGSLDNVVGVVRARHLLSAILAGETLDPRRYVQQAPVVHEHADALKTLEILRRSDVPIALVHDEYGSFEGVVTPSDILEAIAGVFRFDAEEAEPDAVRRDDGSWLVAGSMPASGFATTLGLALPERASYETAAGFVLSHLDHLPVTGEAIETQGWRFEVVDLDGRRIDKLLATKLAEARQD